MAQRVLVWILTVAVVVAIVAGWGRRERGGSAAGVTLFSATQGGCAIVVPSRAIGSEREAAEMLQSALAKSAGRAADAFPIVVEGRATLRGAIFVGATQRSAAFMRDGSKPPWDIGVGYRVDRGGLLLRSERREGIQSAAGWFLEKELGARWFMPGPLGEIVPRRTELSLPPGDVTVRPGFIHRDLLLHSSSAASAWSARNRLERRFEHHHNLANIFKPEDLRRTPEMAPLRGTQRFIPAPGQQGWQPNLLSRAAVEHAANVAMRAFDADPKRLSFSLSANDTDRFDESAATLAAVSPPRFFRHRPDYSDLVFRFSNQVAEIVGRSHPDRWLPTYAYYWSENAPSVRIARNVIPVLTADRSQWSFPEFAAEDRALIEKWCRSGAEIVGVYDYFYGAPFFSPRPMLYAVKQSIPFAHRAGVRVFFAETHANWALDGPKPWLAAQLLWSPERNPDELLELYYREFWAEAAEPMKEFFAICERVWQQQPGPPLWLRYYQDDDQSHIYSASDRMALQTQLSRAASAAGTESVRARVAFTAAGFSVTQAYAGFCAARESLARLTQSPADPRAVFAAWKAYRAVAADFTRGYTEVRREHPLALAPQKLENYLRNQPDGRVARALIRTEEGRKVLRASEYLSEVYLRATEPELTALFARGLESLQDPGWRQVVPIPVNTSAVIDWTKPGAVWNGNGEPWEGRTVEFSARPDGSRMLRMAGCRTEGIGQWLGATPNGLYAAQVKVRAKTSPGTATYLIVSFLDEKSRHLGLGHVDRLPANSAEVQETELCVIVRAPRNARYIGFGVRAQNQINDDFVEFRDASLRRLVD